jgi:hypothetical protein
MLVRDFTDFANVFNGHKPAPAAPDREDLVAVFSHMDQNAGLQDFMIGPFAVIVLDDGRKILPEMPGTQVRQPVFHGFFRVIQS